MDSAQVSKCHRLLTRTQRFEQGSHRQERSQFHQANVTASSNSSRYFPVQAVGPMWTRAERNKPLRSRDIEPRFSQRETQHVHEHVRHVVEQPQPTHSRLEGSVMSSEARIHIQKPAQRMRTGLFVAVRPAANGRLALRTASRHLFWLQKTCICMISRSTSICSLPGIKRTTDCVCPSEHGPTGVQNTATTVHWASGG